MTNMGDVIDGGTADIHGHALAVGIKRPEFFEGPAEGVVEAHGGYDGFGCDLRCSFKCDSSASISCWSTSSRSVSGSGKCEWSSFTPG